MPDDFKAKISVISYPSLTSITCDIYKNGKLHWTSSNLNMDIGITQFANDIAQIIIFDWDVNFWMNLEKPLEAAPDEHTQILYKEKLVSTISVGQNLYDCLSEIGFEEVLNKVNSMPDSTRLTIATNCAFFPWEILNSRAENNQEEPYKKLWGYRFITNYLRIPTPGEHGFSTPEDNYKNDKPNIILSINPTINTEVKGYAGIEPDRPHLEFYSNKIKNQKLGSLLNTGSEIIDSLINSTNDATMIYMYCHGTNNNPFQANSQETLEVDEGINIFPNDLRNRKQDFSRAPIIFLNSCKSGVISPLSFVTFLKMFQAKKALGIIGTTIEIPITFAAVFGVRILESYLHGDYLAQALFDLRRTLLEHNNPLGLFYSFQCPTDVSAPAQNSPSHIPKNVSDSH